MAKPDYSYEKFLARKSWGNIDANYRFLKSSQLLHTGTRVLDVGCGKGALIGALNQDGVEVYGCDRELIVLDDAAPKERIVISNGEELPFADASFDAVLSFDVFEHIPESDKHLSEVRRVLRPCGHYAFSTPNILTNVPFEILRTSARLGIRNVMWAFRPPQHCALHSYWSLRRRLQRHGFEPTFFDVPVANEYFYDKIERVCGKIGRKAVKIINPDKLPMVLRTNFFVIAERSP